MEIVRRTFLTQEIQIPDFMLHALHEEVNRTNLAVAEAVQFWKNSDLKLWCKEGLSQSVLNKVLKPNLNVYSITQPLLLQIKCFRDVSRPAYQQLQKIIQRYGENVLVNAENDNQNIQKEGETGRRMLHLTLSDGVKEIIGMEYQTISSLNLEIPLGTKVKIIPPVICRGGTLLLKSNNIRIIGGRVAEFEEHFCQKKYLASVINADLVELEKSAPPCPPPNVTLAQPIRNNVTITNQNPLPVHQNAVPGTDTLDDDPEVDELMATLEDPGWGPDDVDDDLFNQAAQELENTVILD